MTSTLFGDVCLTRTWGRIGCRGQSKTQLFAGKEDALIVFLDILRRKTVRGYWAPRLLNEPVR
ncbi:WGR domain-containing protein (plasmid) [Agrobacterium sp. rho-8.1]